MKSKSGVNSFINYYLFVNFIVPVLSWSLVSISVTFTDFHTEFVG